MTSVLKPSELAAHEKVEAVSFSQSLCTEEFDHMLSSGSESSFNLRADRMDPAPAESWGMAGGVATEKSICCETRWLVSVRSCSPVRLSGGGGGGCTSLLRGGGVPSCTQ